MAAEQGPSLLAASKTSDSRLSVQVHPLVLLTISDYITRHILRQQQGPVVGAIIGAQNGRETTMEHAFECLSKTDKDGDIVLDALWFSNRVQQYKDVHKSPALDLVGWFTMCPQTGPQIQHLPVHRQLLDQYNESALFLAFHPNVVTDGSSKGGKLPFTVYESVFEAASDGDKHMQESGEGPQLVLRFKELPYSIETGEAEMIAVDFVAKGGANATSRQETQGAKDDSDGKGKKRSAPDGEVKANSNGAVEQEYLTAEEDEKIASLTGKANAIRMLQKRILLIKKYLASVPPCYLNDSSKSVMEPGAQIEHGVLRSIASLLARLPLLTPSTPAMSDRTPLTLVYGRDAAAEATDVALIQLLGGLGETLAVAKSMGSRSSTIDSAKASSRGGKYGSAFTPRLGMDIGDEEAEGFGDEAIDTAMSY